MGPPGFVPRGSQSPRGGRAWGVVRFWGGGLFSPARPRVFSLLCLVITKYLTVLPRPGSAFPRINLSLPPLRGDEEEEGRASERVFAGA